MMLRKPRCRLVNLIRGVDHPTNFWRIGKEGHDLVPCAPPGQTDGWIFLSPFSLELGEPLLSYLARLGPVDRAQRRQQMLSVLPGYKVQTMPDQMNDAGLYDRAPEDGGDCVWEALEPVDHGEVDIVDATVLELVHDAQPELGALALLDPQAEDVLLALAIERQGEIDRLVLDRALVADLDPQRIKEDHRIDCVERPVLPLAHLIEHGIGDPADQVGRDVDGIELAQMALDLAYRHAVGIHRDDLVVEGIEPGLAPWA
jgi:hypothetical protein